MRKLLGFWNKNSVSQAILLVLFCVSIIPIIVVSMVVINLSNSVYAQQLVENLEVLAHIRADEIDEQLQQAEALMGQIDVPQSADLTDSVGREAVARQLGMIFTAVPATQRITLHLPNDTAYQMTADAQQLVNTAPEMISPLDLTTELAWIPSVGNAPPTITLVVPLNSNSGEPLGVLAQEIDFNALYRAHSNPDLLPEAVYNFFQTPHNELLLSIEHEASDTFSNTLVPFIQAQNKQSTSTFQNQSGNDYVLISVPLAVSDWTVNTIVSMDKVVPPASTSMRIRILLVMVAEVVFVVLMAVLLIRTIHRPLKLLMVGVEQMSKDGHAKVITADSFRELNHLAEAFNQMSAKVWERETALKASVARLRIKIDTTQKKEQVESLVQTDFFKELELNATRLRNQLKRE